MCFFAGLVSAAALSAQVLPPASDIFDKDQVHEIRLAFKQADWYQQLTTTYDQNPDNTPYLEGSITWGQYKFDRIGVRFKGNSSYRAATTRKKPFRIKLNEFVKGQKIDGMASFGLSNGWNDPSFVRQGVYSEIAAKTGLAAPRANFAALYINDEYWGLYILGEIVNGDFLEHHFGKDEDSGNLYKASDPGANLAYLGAEPSSYQRFFSKESNEEANDWTDLIELAKVFEETPIADLSSKLDRLIDVESFLMALALDNLTVNLDSYVGMAQNYYLYRRPSDQKWVWIPWDPSLAFGALAQSLTTQQMKDLALEWVQSSGTPGGGGGGLPGGGAVGGRPIANKLWQVPEYKQRYRKVYQGIVDQLMVPSHVIGRMNTLRDLIRPWVDKDTQKLVSMDQFNNAMTSDATTGFGGGGNIGGPGLPGGPGGGGGGGALGGTPGLQPFIEGRVISVKAQLAGEPPLHVSATPASYFFAQVVDSSAAANQDVLLSLPEGKTGTYTARASVPWITLDSTSGSFPATVRFAASGATMTAGTYSGSIIVAAPSASNSPLIIPVVMTVASAPAIVAYPSSLTFTGGNFGFPPGGGGPTGPGGPGSATLSQTLNIGSTAGASTFAVATSDTTCKDFLAATPASGTTPAVVTVTVNPAGATGTCRGTVNVSSSGLASAAIPVTLTIPSGPGGNLQPAITAVVNSASYARGPVAPGTLITIFGVNIGPRNLVRGAIQDGQFATSAGGVQVSFDGTAAPVIYARFDQVGVAVPFEVSGKPQVEVQLSLNGLTTPVLQQPISPTSPGVFTTAQTGTGQAAILNQDGTVNGASAPAARGSTVSFHITGAGELMPPGRSGTLGSVEQRIVAAVTVSIGGQLAAITYAGAAPGSVSGTYQINATVPTSSASGSVPLEITVGNVPAQSGVTMYVQ